MWQVIQHRWIRGSTQNSSNKVWEGGRFKEARGQAKQQLNSHLEMLLKHEFYEDCDWDISVENHSAEMRDYEGLAYSIRYEVKEVI